MFCQTMSPTHHGSIIFEKNIFRILRVCEKISLSLKKLMQQGMCNPEFYGDLVYKFKKIIGNPNYSYSKSFQESMVFLRQTACLVFNPIMVEGYAALFSCMAVVQASDSMMASM